MISNFRALMVEVLAVAVVVRLPLILGPLPQMIVLQSSTELHHNQDNLLAIRGHDRHRKTQVRLRNSSPPLL